jgi:CheY-like chemotaxis protein
MAKRILFVDDDLYIRDLYEEVLKEKGYNVDTAINGEEGLAKLQVGGYDLVLLDVMMPTLDGIGVLEELQKNPAKTPNGPIVLLTNLGLDPLIKSAKSKGVASYLVKSDLTPGDLVATVKKLLGE